MVTPTLYCASAEVHSVFSISGLVALVLTTWMQSPGFELAGAS